MKSFVMIILISMLLSASGCAFLPQTAKTGDTQTLEISEAAPDSTLTHLKLGMGAGKLNLSGGSNNLVSGSIEINVVDWKPTISRTANSVSLIQDTSNLASLPTLNTINNWTLKLGKTPLDLEINAGAYEGVMDFTGLSISNLLIADGASKNKVNFNEPNPIPMSNFDYKTGASSVDLNGLGNANAASITFEGGAGTFNFDFSGKLKQNLDFTFKGGVSTLSLTFPSGVPVNVLLKGALTDVNTIGTWTSNGKNYSSQGAGFAINVTIDMGLGTLKLITQ